MTTIEISTLNGPSSSTIEVDGMDVTIKDAFTGIRLVSPDGEQLSVCMRDGGFEVHYESEDGPDGFDAGWIALKDGKLKKL